MPQNPPNRFAIAYHPTLPQAAAQAEAVQHFLQAQGVNEIICAPLPTLRQQLQPGQAEVLIALGGDGTMLRAGHLCAPLGIPILGINLGRFGFLMEVRREDWRRRLPLLLRGEYWLEERMMLLATHLRAGQELSHSSALNEVVVCRGQHVRPVRLRAAVDGYPLTTYIADGLIVATATGSTAYALAVGGPIMPPELRSLLVVAVAPHLSMDRAVILPEEAQVTVTVLSGHQAVMSVDGQPPIPLEDGDEVRVRANHHTVKFVRFQDRGYFYRNLNAYMELNPAAMDDER